MSDQTDIPREQSATRRAVCLRCARIKQACDGGSPCSRCKRLDVECEPNITGASGSSGKETKNKNVKITRTHTGCLTCKKRRRKCDESKPKCSDCRRLCLDCSWPPPTHLTRQTSNRSPPADTSPIITQTTSAAESEELVLDFSLDFTEETGDSQSSGDWTELWPVSSQSQLAVRSPASTSTYSPDTSSLLVVLSTAPDVVLDADKSLLNHYMKVVAGVLSRRDDNRSNPYLTKLLPMAFSSQLVMDAVLALSANHWKKLQPTVWKRGIVHQTNVLQALAKLLPHIDNNSADAALSATLLLCMIEVFDGTSSHWKYHLDGARRLLSAFDQKADWSYPSEFRTFCRQLYHYIDSATTISTCAPPLLEAPKGNPEKEGHGSPRYDINDEQALYGIPKSLFHFVDKINGLAYQRKFRDDPVFETMFRASATSLENDLERWIEDRQVNGSEEDPTLHPDIAAAQQATIAFEQALQLRLHQIVNGYSLEHEKVGQCVSKILNAIQLIRYGSPLESCLIFPLVMAGGSCDTENERLIVRDRFLVMERTLGFRYVYTAHELVQRVWKQREQSQGTNEDVNWAAIRYYQIPGLALV